MSNVQKELSPINQEDKTSPSKETVASSNLERKRSSLTIQIDPPKILHSDSTARIEQRTKLFTNRMIKFIKYKGTYESTLYLPDKYKPEFQQDDLVRALGLGSFSIVVSLQNL